jgi:hypothetical protein
MNTLTPICYYFTRRSTITIPDSVTGIGDHAFYENRLTSVTIPANVDAVEGLFDGNLAHVYTRGGKAAGTYTAGDGGRTWQAMR